MPASYFVDTAGAMMANASAVCSTAIPVEAYSVIQEAVTKAIITWELTFALIGLCLGFAISYLYFRIWYAENRIGELIEENEESE